MVLRGRSHVRAISHEGQGLRSWRQPCCRNGNWSHSTGERTRKVYRGATVTANFKEAQMSDMRPGQHVEIYVDTDGRTYSGHIDRIAGASGARYSLLPPENATGNYVKVVQRIPVKIFFETGQDTKHLLRPGMSVEPNVRVQ